MKTRLCLALMSVFVVAVAQAQPQRGGRGPGHRGPRGVERLAQRLAEELNLTDAQRTEFDAIVRQFEEQMSAERDAHREQLRQLASDFREARADGDEARADQIREQMRDVRAARRDAREGFFEQVEPILDDQQKQTLQDLRQRFAERRGARRERGGRYREMIQALPERLNLTDDQRTQFDQLLADHRENRGLEDEETRERYMALQQEMQAAREADDRDKMRELFDEMRGLRSAGRRERMATFFGQLEEILTDEQKTTLTELRQEMRGGNRRGAGDNSLRSLMRAVQRLRLEGETRQAAQEVLNEARRQERSISRRDEDARQSLFDATKSDLLALLDADQAAEFETLLENAGRRGPGRGAGFRHHGRGGGRGPR